MLHVNVGYINDLISIEGLHYITSAAMQGLLRDRCAVCCLPESSSSSSGSSVEGGGRC
jgi:hypothetical protein